MPCMLNDLQQMFASAWAIWMDVPSGFWKLLIPFLWMVITAAPLVFHIRAIERIVRRRVDVIVLSGLFAWAFYGLLFVAITALGVRVTSWSFWSITSLTGLMAWTSRILVSRKRQDTQLRRPSSVVITSALFIIILVAGSVRFDNTLRFPDLLMGSDSYRHYPRTEWIVQTGRISSTDPWLEGDVPVFEAQGCYVMAAYFSRVSGLEAWLVWKYGSVLFGIWSLLAVYLLGTYVLPGLPRPFAGIMAAIFLAALPVHIWRTNMGFSETWALPLIPLAFLALIWSVRDRSFGCGIVFGICFTASAWSNMIPPLYSLFFLFPWCIFVTTKALLYDLRRAWRNKHLDDEVSGWSRTLAGLIASVVLFCGFIWLWDATYALLPLTRGAVAHGHTTHESLSQAVHNFNQDKIRLYQKQYGDTEEAIRAETAQFKRQHGLFAYHAARFMGAFRERLGVNYHTHYMQEYITWPVLRLGLIGTIFLGLSYSALFRRYTASQHLLDDAVKARSDMAVALTFLVCGLVITLSQFVWLETLVQMGVPTFQSKGYRLLLYPGYFISLIMALALENAINMVAQSAKVFSAKLAIYASVRFSGFVTAFLLVTMHAASGTYHGWKPLFTEPEHKTLIWAMDNLPSNSVIICEWFQADFVRSLSLQAKRPIQPVFSRLRPEIKGSIDKSSPPLVIPELQSIEDALSYAATSPDMNFYIMETRFGTGWKPEQDFRLTPLVYHQDDQNASSLWALPGNPQLVRGSLAGPIPMGDADGGEIRNLNRLHDGTIGENTGEDAAYSHDPEQKGPFLYAHQAWFGLRFPASEQIDGVRAYFGWYKRPGLALPRPMPDLMFLPTAYVFQYLDHQGEWINMERAESAFNRSALVVHEVESITTEAIRVVLYDQRNMMGRQRGGLYRAAMLELDYKRSSEAWPFLDGLLF